MTVTHPSSGRAQDKWVTHTTTAYRSVCSQLDNVETLIINS